MSWLGTGMALPLQACCIIWFWQWGTKLPSNFRRFLPKGRLLSSAVSFQKCRDSQLRNLRLTPPATYSRVFQWNQFMDQVIQAFRMLQLEEHSLPLDTRAFVRNSSLSITKTIFINIMLFLYIPRYMLSWFDSFLLSLPSSVLFIWLFYIPIYSLYASFGNFCRLWCARLQIEDKILNFICPKAVHIFNPHWTRYYFSDKLRCT